MAPNGTSVQESYTDTPLSEGNVRLIDSNALEYDEVSGKYYVRDVICRDDIDDLKERSKMTNQKAIRKFNEFYDKATKLSYVEKPISWALYQTWKWFDKNEKSRITESEGTDESRN